MTTSTAPIEKTALETYVPPAKPSLIGFSRAELGDKLGAIGVASGQRKMRTQQLWHWLYVRGAQSFEQMTDISKTMRRARNHFVGAASEVVAEQISEDGTRKGCCGCRAAMPPNARTRSSVYIPEPTAARCAVARLAAR